MNTEIERLAVWWAECFAALAKGISASKADSSAAKDRFSASIKLLGEAQGLAARAMQRLDDLTPLLEETHEMIGRLQGETGEKPLKRPGKPGTGAAIVLVHGDPGPCAECRGEVGAGPVGWRESPDPGPLCNYCLTHSNPDLGAFMGIVNLMRRTARMAPRERDDPDAAGQALIELARRYARANSAPLRPTDLLSQAIELHQRMVERHGPHYPDEMKRQGGAQKPN